jgi:hypothetical protein
VQSIEIISASPYRGFVGYKTNRPPESCHSVWHLVRPDRRLHGFTAQAGAAELQGGAKG